MAEFRLETERLILRDWREADAVPFFRHTNTPAVMRWLGGLLDDKARAAIWGRLATYRDQHGHTFWAVDRRADGGHLSGQLLGFCGLKRCNQEGGPIGDFEIGWRFREDAWGHGYAKEAALAARDAAFEIYGAPHVIALTIAENTASWGLMLRIGMRRREDLDFADTTFGSDTMIVYSLDRADWEGLRHAA